MCDVDDQANEQGPERKNTPATSEPQQCAKCKVERAVCFVRRAHFCKTCFLDSVQYRFRLNLMRATKIGEGKNVLVAFSGGLSSRVLLHAISAFNSVDPRKKRKFNGLVDHTDIIRKIVESYGHTLLSIPLEDVFANGGAAVAQPSREGEGPLSLHVKLTAQSPGSSVEKLQKCFSALGKLSSKEDLLHYLTMQLLYAAARRNDCHGLLLGDNSTRVAIRTIAQVSKGRGFAMPIDVASECDWLRDVILLRPLRDVDAKEIGLCNQYEGLETVHVPNLTTAMPTKASIDRLTEDFITGLQRDFPSTVSTVARTAFKTSTEWNAEGVERCALCSGLITLPTCHYLKPIIRTFFRRMLRNKRILRINVMLLLTRHNFIRDAKDEAKRLSRKGGEVVSKDVAVILPPFVMDTVEKSRGREWMRREIEGFLIEDDE
ncbi:Cytoplasmic tRNA 2-thiolation protein 2 [Rhizophlyctis rosea]|nr:Cytoplasmic tRNA 2-thiolation protein 2 [Rhizophlyctis rosea]